MTSRQRRGSHRGKRAELEPQLRVCVINNQSVFIRHAAVGSFRAAREVSQEAGFRGSAGACRRHMEVKSDQDRSQRTSL